jgi:hypothetical protein
MMRTVGQLARGKWGTDDVVLVADKRSRHTFERSLHGIEELRAAGVALPD